MLPTSRPTPSAGSPCPCGAPSYDACCGPLLEGRRQAATAEELMRSRYTAYAVGDGEHLWRSWHPRTRPAAVEPSPGLAWRGLTVVRTEDGGPDDDRGVVAFRAAYDAPDGPGVLEEVSAFERRAGRWFYVAALDGS